jgi:hypothetical protein
MIVNLESLSLFISNNLRDEGMKSLNQVSMDFVVCEFAGEQI